MNYLVLVIYTIILFLKSQNFKLIFLALLIFNISIILRTIDNLVCDIFKIGTHFFGIQLMPICCLFYQKFFSKEFNFK